MNILKKAFLVAIIGIILMVLAIWYIRENTYTATIKCEVVSHSAVGDKFGDVHYTTILKCEDSFIRTESSLRYYVLPIGTITSIEEHKWK
jgi:hypothetical protein